MESPFASARGPVSHAALLLRSRLKMRQLLLVSSLGETRNLRRSAAALAMTQPTATKLLHELESALGALLFERSQRGMTPTSAGLTMIRHARGLMADVDAASEEIQALAEGASGMVTVGAMASTASTVLPRATAALAARHPRLRIAIQEGTHAMLVDALRKGDVDFVLGRVMGGADMDDLDHEVLYQDEFCIVSGARHPLARRRKISLDALTGQRWILPHSSAPLRQRLDILFMAQAQDRPRYAVESVSLLTNMQMLQEGAMLGVMPLDIARHFAHIGQLRILPVQLGGLYGPVALVTRRGRDLSPAARLFVDEIKTAGLAR
ncbi:MAG: LysR family transcriptional regulator [Pseudomonadota bacterium]